jgi:hypothetical protein
VAVATPRPLIVRVLLGLPFALSMQMTCVEVPLLKSAVIARLIYPAR